MSTIEASAGLDSATSDTGSPERIIEAMYAAISAPAGVAPAWDRFRALFAPGARLIPTNRGEGRPLLRGHDVEGYIASNGAMLTEMSFDERQVAHRTERFGNVAHVWSTYESRHAPEDAEPFGRGINSIQLYHDGRRWWVMTVFWDSERADNPIPPAYLPS